MRWERKRMSRKTPERLQSASIRIGLAKLAPETQMSFSLPSLLRHADDDSRSAPAEMLLAALCIVRFAPKMLAELPRRPMSHNR